MDNTYEMTSNMAFSYPLFFPPHLLLETEALQMNSANVFISCSLYYVMQTSTFHSPGVCILLFRPSMSGVETMKVGVCAPVSVRGLGNIYDLLGFF